LVITRNRAKPLRREALSAAEAAKHLQSSLCVLVERRTTVLIKRKLLYVVALRGHHRLPRQVVQYIGLYNPEIIRPGLSLMFRVTGI